MMLNYPQTNTLQGAPNIDLTVKHLDSPIILGEVVRAHA